MDSWWELGEGFSGNQGERMEVGRITCAFCGERGNFALLHHEEKKKPNSSKRLNFDLYECHNCRGFVHVLWSASEFSYGHGPYEFRILPWPLLGKRKPSQNWPKEMHRFWVQAHDSLRNENWDAAVLMARSAVQFVVREKKAKKGTLNQEIEDLVAKGVLHPLMAEWSHEVRALGRDSAHPDPGDAPTDPQDARDIVNFLDSLLLYLYDLPEQIRAYRERKNPKTLPPASTKSS
jgi:hypothetical protein